MDELTLLRRMRDEVAEPTAEQLRPAFSSLEARMKHDSRRPRRSASSRIGWAFGPLGAVASAAVAAVIVAGVVVTQTGGPTPDGPAAERAPSHSSFPSAPTVTTASVVFAAAAANTGEVRDLLVEPGEFLRVETTTESLQTWSSEWSTDGDDRTNPFNADGVAAPADGVAAPVDGAILWRDTRQLYVPSDQTAEWTWVSDPQTIIETYGSYVDRMLADAALPENAITRETAGTITVPNGTIPGRDGTGLSPLDTNRPFYDEMPRDPRTLLEWYRQQSGDEGSAADRWVVSSIEPLTLNLAPAEIRAATFKALALIDGMKVTQHSDQLATIDYRADDGMTFTLTVDMEHGFLRSVSETTTRADGSPGEGVPDTKQTVTIDVVSEKP